MLTLPACAPGRSDQQIAGAPRLGVLPWLAPFRSAAFDSEEGSIEFQAATPRSSDDDSRLTQRLDPASISCGIAISVCLDPRGGEVGARHVIGM